MKTIFFLILFLFYSVASSLASRGNNKYCSGVCVKAEQCLDKNNGPVIDKRIELSDEAEVYDGCEETKKCCLEENVVPEVITIEDPDFHKREHISSSTLRNDEPTPCGYRKIEGLGFRVVENEDWETEYGEFAWMAAVYQNSKFICGGSLIHPRVVLTSAHNIEGRKLRSLIVKLGEWDRNSTNELLPTQDREITDIIIHPNYDSIKVYYDASLLILNENVNFVFHIHPICLPPQHTNFEDENCLSTGWGKPKYLSKTLQDILRKVELPILTKSRCENQMKKSRLGPSFELHKSFICAGGDGGKDTCTGDGGSPLVCLKPGSKDQYYQAGIVSWGIGCGDYPGIYTNVAAIRPWIDKELEERGMSVKYYTAH